MKKILVIRFSSVGDIVMTLPVAGALKELYGEDCKIVWMTKKVYADLVTSNKFIDEVIYFEDFQDKWFRIIKEIVRNVNKWFNKRTFKNLTVIKNFLYLFPVNKKLSNYKFDLVLDLQGTIESSVLSISTRAAVRLIPWHVKNGAERFAKQIIPDTDNKHEIEKYLDVVRFLSKNKSDKISFGWDFTESDKNLLKDLCKKNNIDLKKPYVILPLRTQWESKNYPLEYWADIIKYFNKVGATAVVCGTNSDKRCTENLRALLGDSYNFIDLCGKTTMKQLILLINYAKLIISSDSGPMHIAYSLGKPLIALFGATNPKIVGPMGGEVHVLQIDRECRCCKKKLCPRNLDCLRNIKPELVINIIKRFFKKGLEYDK